VQAAIAVQRAISSSDFPCGIGIGLFTGVVVAGAIGVADRMDYTVIGDSVNIAARLCPLAKARTIVADSRTVINAGVGDFGQARQVSVRGRTAKIEVRSMRVT
jgi:class 3 adenylate cyclase